MADIVLNPGADNYTDPAGQTNRVFGLGGNDTLRGADGNDTLVGGAGNDLFVGGTGNDFFDGTSVGGRDNDTVSFSGTGGFVGVSINLATGIGTDTTGNTDTYLMVEELVGSTFADRLTGGNVANDFFEGFAGLAGNDTISGASGTDEARYDADFQAGGTAGVTVNLTTGTAVDGFGNTDTLFGIEMVRGSRLGDTLIGGSPSNNGFEGFQGLAGNDTINGGEGYDEARYHSDAAYGGGGGVTVNLQTGTATDGFGNTDTLISVEGVRGTQFADRFFGEAMTNANDFNQFYGLAGNDTIDGGGVADDYDEVRYDRDAQFGGMAGVTVNLATGTAIDGFGNVDTLLNIEAACGTEFADNLRGKDGDSRVNEAFVGLAGNDTINGGAGGRDETRYDRDSGLGGNAAVTVNLATGTAVDGFGNTDTLIGIEMVRGTRFADTLIGGNAANAAFEGFMGLAGNDIISGGAGFDEVRYHRDAANGGMAGIVANLATGTVVDGYGNTDQISGIEGVLGSFVADRMTGDGNDNRFQGLSGDDTIDGGGGTDTIRFQIDDLFEGTQGVNVNLTTGVAIDTFGDTDSLASIENVLGSIFGDTIIGSAVANSLVGDLGDDTLSGGGGNDGLEGGDGNDVLAGGAGADGLLGGAGVDVADYSSSTGVQVALDGTLTRTGDAVGDAFSQVEGLRGSATGNDFLRGNAGNNTLEGLGGNDGLDGGIGNDVLIGGAGADGMLGGDGVDMVTYAASSGVRVSLDNSLVATGEAIGDAFSRIETLEGSLTGADHLRGNASNNTLSGRGGNDLLEGGLGGDWLLGGEGFDTLDGGAGSDTFLFIEPIDPGTFDTILNYSVAEDSIRLSLAIFPGIHKAGSFASPVSFVIGAAAADASDRIIYNSTTGALFYDADGTGATAQVQFAQLSAGLAMTNQDFLITL